MIEPHLLFYGEHIVHIMFDLSLLARTSARVKQDYPFCFRSGRCRLYIIDVMTLTCLLLIGSALFNWDAHEERDGEMERWSERRFDQYENRHDIGLGIL